MKPAFVFDFDGVIVDSLGALYRVYLEFMADFGLRGNPGEFDDLNGPKLPEIVSILKARHALPGSPEDLLSLYLGKLGTLYHGVELIPGVEGVLDRIRRAGAPLALASSSKREAIMAVLERFQLDSYFEYIITGDEVDRAKPHPEIYSRVGDHFPDHHCYVVEDSAHGLAAARGAGMATLHYDPEESFEKSGLAHCDAIAGAQKFHGRVTSMAQLGNSVLEILVGCTTMARFHGPVELCLEGAMAPVDDRIKERVAAIWEEKGQGRFNGRILTYHSHDQGSCTSRGKTSIIRCQSLEYRTVFAQLMAPDLGLDIRPLAVSGLILDRDGKTLVGQRSQVSQYPGRWELVPSGGMDSTMDLEQGVGAQLSREFEEETGWDRGRIRGISPFCLVRNGNHGNYDIGALIRLDGSLGELPGPNGEYKAFRAMDLLDVRDTKALDEWVPTSLVLVALAMDLI